MSIYQPVKLFSIVYTTTYILTDINTFIHVDNYFFRHVDNQATKKKNDCIF